MRSELTGYFEAGTTLVSVYLGPIQMGLEWCQDAEYGVEHQQSRHGDIHGLAARLWRFRSHVHWYWRTKRSEAAESEWHAKWLPKRMWDALEAEARRAFERAGVAWVPYQTASQEPVQLVWSGFPCKSAVFVGQAAGAFFEPVEGIDRWSVGIWRSSAEVSSEAKQLLAVLELMQLPVRLPPEEKSDGT